MMIDVEQLLENTIPEPNTGCLLWLGSCMKSGYGEVTRGGRNGLYVHRLVWEHFHGPIPPGRFVCHRCDVRSCINDNPADTGHLFLGTPADNIHDAMSKNRLEITRALVTSPKLLLLDEPFAGIDPIAVYEVQKIVRRLKQRGLGILVTDHSVREMLKLIDRGYIIYKGQVLVEGTAEFLANDPKAREIYLGPEFNL